MSYRQITSDERYMIARLRQHRFNQAEIADILGRHRSSISRECRRNCSDGDGPYRPCTAAERARARRTRSRRNSQFTWKDWHRVERLLRHRWSPEQIAGRLHPQRDPLDQSRND